MMAIKWIIAFALVLIAAQLVYRWQRNRIAQHAVEDHLYYETRCKAVKPLTYDDIWDQHAQYSNYAKINILDDRPDNPEDMGRLQ